MALNKFNLSAWSSNGTSFAAKVPAKLFRGLFTRSLTIPAATSALLFSDDGSRRLAPAGENVPLDGLSRIVFVRTAPLELVFQLGNLIGSDMLFLDLSVRLSVQASKHESDLAAVEEHLLLRDDTADKGAIRKALEPSLIDGVRTWCSVRPMQIMDAAGCAEIDQVASASCRKVAFGYGVELCGVEHVTPESAAYRDQSAAEQKTQKAIADLKLQEEIERRRHEGQVAKVERLERMASRLNALKEQFLRRQPGGADRPRRGGPARRLLRRPAGPVPRGPPLPAPVRRRGPVGAGVRPARLRAAGRHALRPAAARVGALGAGAGRRRGRVRLGGRLPVRGVVPAWRRHPGANIPCRPMPGSGTSRAGSTRVCRAGDRLYASHSEVGLCTWRLDGDGREGRLVRPPMPSAAAVRGVTSDPAGRVLFSWDNFVLRLDPARLDPAAHDPARPDGEAVDARQACDSFAGSDSEITCLLALEEHILAGTAGGRSSAGGRLARRRDAEELEPQHPQGVQPGARAVGQRRAVADRRQQLRRPRPRSRRPAREPVQAHPVSGVLHGGEFGLHLRHRRRPGAHPLLEDDRPREAGRRHPRPPVCEHSAKDLAVLTGPSRELDAKPPGSGGPHPGDSARHSISGPGVKG